MNETHSNDARKKRDKTPEPNLWVYPNGVYYYRKGKIEEAIGRFDSFREAVQAKKIYERKVDELGVLAFKLRADDVLDDYLADREDQRNGRVKGRRSISGNTLKECKDLTRLHLRPFFGRRKLSEISEPLWNKYCAQAKVGDLSNHRKVFRHFIGWCKQKGYVRYVPDFKIPHVERRARKVLKSHEIKALLANANGSLLLFVSMYLFMGMRAGESLRLKWERVDLKGGTIGLLKAQVKTRRARAITINPFVLHLLRDRRREQEMQGIQTPWVFPNALDYRRPADKTGLKTSWKTCLKRAGLRDITPHDLRATFEYFANKRPDFTDAQREKFAGASITVQKSIYVDFDADDVRGLELVVEVDGLEEILNKKMAVGENAGKTDFNREMISDKDAKTRGIKKGKNKT